MRENSDFDVAIIGCGPVGALLANLLGARGLRVAVLEREAAQFSLPRAVHFDGEVMRIFQSVGLADAIARLARASSKGMRFVNASGHTLMIRRGFEGAGPHGWASNWVFHQPHLDAALRQGMTRFASVKLFPRHEVFAIDIDTAGALVRAEDLSCGALRAVRAQYVIGCDGARSLVRRLIGSSSEDLGLHQPWLVVDLLMQPESSRTRDLPEYSVQVCDPQRPMTLVYIGGNRRRWEIMVMPGDDPAELATPAYFLATVVTLADPEDATVERATVYHFHSVISRGWRRGPLLLAGDSCHQSPPFLGQGLCAGFRDAANLAWKLDLVVKGLADAALLDTYEVERRPHVHAFIRLAVDLGSFVQTTDPTVAAERDRALGDDEPLIFEYPKARLGRGVHDGSSAGGAVFAQPALSDGRLLDEATGGRFAIIGAPPLLGGVNATARGVWDTLGAAVIADPSPALANRLAECAAAAVILRPDAYVLGIAQDAEELSQLSLQLPNMLRLKTKPVPSILA